MRPFFPRLFFIAFITTASAENTAPAKASLWISSQPNNSFSITLVAAGGMSDAEWALYHDAVEKKGLIASGKLEKDGTVRTLTWTPTEEKAHRLFLCLKQQGKTDIAATEVIPMQPAIFGEIGTYIGVILGALLTLFTAVPLALLQERISARAAARDARERVTAILISTVRELQQNWEQSPPVFQLPEGIDHPEFLAAIQRLEDSAIAWDIIADLKLVHGMWTIQKADPSHRQRLIILHDRIRSIK